MPINIHALLDERTSQRTDSYQTWSIKKRGQIISYQDRRQTNSLDLKTRRTRRNYNFPHLQSFAAFISVSKDPSLLSISTELLMLQAKWG